MADRLTPQRRSWLMSRVPGKDTSPELRVRKTAHRMGLRFRLHRKDLPGRPDMVFPKYRTVLFVHGCFWHRHDGCRKSGIPKTRSEYWRRKFEANVSRDARNRLELEKSNWRVCVLWECQTKNEQDIHAFLKREILAADNALCASTPQKAAD